MDEEINITRKVVDKWLENNRPDLVTFENFNNGDRGFYRKDLGPAMSFKAIGKTWKVVLEHLKTSNQ